MIVFLLTLCLGVASHDSLAQFGVALGPKGGFSVTSLGGDPSNIDRNINWLGGIFVNIQLSPVVNIQPEAILNEKGADFTRNGERRDLEVQYIDVPILLKLRVPIDDVFFPHILLGPNGSFRTDIDYTSRNTDNGTVVTVSKNDIRKADIGGIVGAGMDLQTRRSGIFFTIDGRYGFGFTNIDDTNDSFEIRNRGWMFSLGIGLLLTK